jgi:CubicO group peptidase (beta-lactamase class C family)
MSRLNRVGAVLLFAVAQAGAARGQGQPTFFNRNVPGECAAKMKALAAAGQQLRCVAFSPGGGWSVVTDKAVFNHNLPGRCDQKMRELHAAGHTITCVAFPPGGGDRWSIVTDRTFVNQNVPDECHRQMNDLFKGGHKLLCVAFPPTGGNRWSIITDRTIINRNVPDECDQRMRQMTGAGQTLLWVAFPPGGGNRWTVISDRSFFNRRPPEECHRVMRAMSHSGLGPVRVVAFQPAGPGWSVVSGAGPEGRAHPPLVVAGEQFSLDRFAEELKKRLDGKGVKYAFLVRYGPAVRCGAAGPKRTAATPPAQDFTVFDRFNPASVTKPVTAVALLQLLEKRNLSVDQPLYPYLPSTWKPHASVKTITFKQLLNHTSGFRTGGQTYDELRKMVEKGVKPSDKVPSYSNLNYALARIVVAYLDGYKEAGVADHGRATSQAFINYLQRNVFDRLSIPGVQFRPDADAPTLFYPFPPGRSRGTTYGDWSTRPGSAGVHLSVAELSIFLDKLFTSNVLLSARMREQMCVHGLGWTRKTRVKHGWYCSKGGYFPGAMNGGAQLHSTIVTFNTGVQATVVLNGKGDMGVLQAYANAWAPVAP